MKQLILPAVLLATIFIFSFGSCRPKDDEVAGKGGKASLKVTPQHHGDNIDSCTVFLKYNTQDLPTDGYDEQVVCVMENGKPVATFTELKKGNYYVFGNGWDPDIEQVVVGGTPYKITEDKTYNINVPVTEEGH